MEPQLVLDSHHGVYIPQLFGKMVLHAVLSNHETTTTFNLAGVDYVANGLSVDDIAEIRKGPEAEWYWESWENVLNATWYEGDTLNQFELAHDEDLWLKATCLEDDDEDEWDERYNDSREEFPTHFEDGPGSDCDIY